MFSSTIWSSCSYMPCRKFLHRLHSKIRNIKYTHFLFLISFFFLSFFFGYHNQNNISSNMQQIMTIIFMQWVWVFEIYRPISMLHVLHFRDIRCLINIYFFLHDFINLFVKQFIQPPHFFFFFFFDVLMVTSSTVGCSPQVTAIFFCLVLSQSRLCQCSSLFHLSMSFVSPSSMFSVAIPLVALPISYLFFLKYALPISILPPSFLKCFWLGSYVL